MQSEIWCYKFRIANISVIISNKILLTSARGSGERCKLPQWDPGQSPKSQSIFRFYIAKFFKNGYKYYLVDQFVVNILIATKSK